MAAGSTILITGAAGFIGSAIGRALSNKGHAVVGFDLMAPANSPFPIFSGDVRESDTLIRVCQRHGVNRIIHGGGISGRSVARSDRTGTIDVNVNGTAAVLEAAIGCGARKFVLCSSGSVYGRSTQDLVTEDTPVEPVNAYGASKVGAEAVMRAYHSEYALDTVALRIFQAYGPNRRTRCTISTILRAAVSHEPAQFVIGPTARMQYVYIADVISAIEAAILSEPLPRLIYNVPGDRTLTLEQAVQIATTVLPRFSVRFEESKLTDEYCLKEVDYTAAARDLGYSPQFDLEHGIRDFAGQIGTIA